MVKIIEGRDEQAGRLADRIAEARTNPATDLGAWTPEVLRVTEAVAGDMANEVAEWSVLYAKEILEP